MVLGFTKTWVVDGKTIKTNFEEKIKKGIKFHTIREDITERWKPGMKIHFATGVRSSRYNCFKEGECVSVQDIYINSNHGIVTVDGVTLDEITIEELAVNDGFDSVNEFWDWFTEYSPFVGRLIHWSNFKYSFES